MRKLYACAVPCLVCGTRLENFEPDGNHPLGGLEFTTPGHYGSAVFDWQPGRLVINICDPCVRDAAEAGRVLNLIPPPRDTRRGETTKIGSTEGESAVPKGDAQ